ncbi:EPIDERMAL PATTERNING FACTOR-like protein 2 [Typha angustifolia]|uniref:EPIDERMAL PATTERNING FACTOR-like protein 2 n=1 Tax=Typha angustifolia TaxID=59011 RepID=UPI003C305DAF
MATFMQEGPARFSVSLQEESPQAGLCIGLRANGCPFAPLPDLTITLLISTTIKMGPLYCSVNTSRNAHLLSLLLLLSSFQAPLHSAEGRELWKLQEVPKGRAEEGMVMVEAMIGSRPPSCQGRCISCGHCEAVQMPVAPQDEKGGIGHLFKVITSKFDDSSNYKPLNWKCKCGDIILNP